MGAKKNLPRTIKEYNCDTQIRVDSKAKTYVSDMGEQIHVVEVEKKYYGNENFWKIFLLDFLTVLGIVESKQLTAFVYIMENIQPSTNLVIATITKISEETGVSVPTVRRLIKKLLEVEFLTKVQTGVYMVSPQYLYKGNPYKKNILIKYEDAIKGGNDMEESDTATYDEDADLDAQLQIIGQDDQNRPIIGEKTKKTKKRGNHE